MIRTIKEGDNRPALVFKTYLNNQMLIGIIATIIASFVVSTWGEKTKKG